MKKQKYDAILVLGVSTKKKLFKKRVDKAVELYKKGVAAKIIFTGRCWGGLKKKPEITEAELMSKYAIKSGVSPSHILIEKRSLNTAGNFYFTKKQILEPEQIKKILVITQPDHFPKAKYFAGKILGQAYALSWISDDTKIKSVFPGHASLEEIKRFFCGVKDGDDKNIAELLRRHPHYKHYRRI